MLATVQKSMFVCKVQKWRDINNGATFEGR